jgi:hypothetical protein
LELSKIWWRHDDVTIDMSIIDVSIFM